MIKKSNKVVPLSRPLYPERMSLARIYSALGAQELSNDVLFKALSYHPKQFEKDTIFQMLAMNFLDMNQADVAEYYLADYADMLGIDFQELEEMQAASNEKRGGFHIVYPHGEDYYEMLIEKAYGLVKEHKFDEAIALLDEVDPRSKSKDAANHVVLVCLMMKEDIDGVIDNAKKMLMSIYTSDDDDDTLTMQETRDISAFMDRFKDDDIDTKFGIAYMPDMGRKVKIIILASGFGLRTQKFMAPNMRKDNADVADEEQSTIDPEGRRPAFYDTASFWNVRNIFTFDDSDLDNDNIIDAVAASDTKTRKYNTLRSIVRASARNLKTISFVGA